MKGLLLVFIATLLLLNACKKEAATNPYTIRYTVNCTNCDVFYTKDQTGAQGSEFNKNSSWTYSFEAKKNQEVLLLAYNKSSSPEAITATILLNDEVLETRTTYCPISGYAFCVDTIQ